MGISEGGGSTRPQAEPGEAGLEREDKPYLAKLGTRLTNLTNAGPRDTSEKVCASFRYGLLL